MCSNYNYDIKSLSEALITLSDDFNTDEVSLAEFLYKLGDFDDY